LDTRSSPFDIDDENQLHRLSEWVGQWEPCVSICRPQRDAVLYEPEGTLYAIAVGTTMTINLFHRERTVRKGDAIVVPQGLAIEINPEVDLLAIRSTGTPPGHFRERFIQVWGYDHFSADHAHSEADTPELHQVIRESDPRFPLSYAIWQPQQTRAGRSFRVCENELVLLLNLNRQAVRVEIDCDPPALEIPAGHVIGLRPGLGHQVCGPGGLGRIRIVSEPVFVARDFLRRTSRGGSYSP
jgi:hypothetical protein